MIREQHYLSLKECITNLLSGLDHHQDELPEEIHTRISETFYHDALSTLTRKKNKLDKREEEYRKAAAKFSQEYEQVRKAWKKDVIRIRRLLMSRGYHSKLEDFGIGK